MAIVLLLLLRMGHRRLGVVVAVVGLLVVVGCLVGLVGFLGVDVGEGGEWGWCRWS